MFTGIVETMGTVTRKTQDGTNLHFWVEAPITSELQIDQSVSHNGICLTVVQIENEQYCVTAIEETLNRTNLGQVQIGAKLNLERCMKADGRFDGHVVQGHVDQCAMVTDVAERDGSWNISFNLEHAHAGLIVEKGSICLNGVSLTVVDVGNQSFSVSIIPYTFEHTNFHALKVGERVNVEFDVLGKYVAAAVARMGA